MKVGDLFAGRYRMERQLGEGGYGVVWAAHREETGRPVAIKVLKGRQTAEQRARFKVEGRALGRLVHPHAVVLFDVGHTDDGEPYLVMERVDGAPLDELRGRGVSLDDITVIGAQLADVLSRAHAVGIVHRDLKPHNVLYLRTDNGLTVKVLDFGIAKLFGDDSPDVTKSGDVFGTPAYMSPEQLRGTRDAGPESDVYSLGVMLYELIDGRRPFGGSSVVEFALGHMKMPVPTLERPDVPTALSDIVLAMLAKDAGERPTMRDVAGALARMSPRGVSPEPPVPAASLKSVNREPETITQPYRSRRKSLMALACVAGLVAGAAFLALRTPPPAPVNVPPPRSRPPQPTTKHRAPEEPDASAADSDAAAFADAPCGEDAPHNAVSLVIEGTRRNALVQVPQSYDARKRLPALLMFHREPVVDRKSGLRLVAESNIIPHAKKHGFIIIALDAVDRRRPWQVGDNDFEAVEAVLKHAEDNACLDRSRIFVIGHDQGGAIATEYACHAKVSALALLHDPVPEGFEGCSLPQPIPVLRIHGTKDKLAPPQGGEACVPGLACDLNLPREMVRSNDAPRLCSSRRMMSAKQIDTSWREKLGCRGEAREWFTNPHGTCRVWAGDGVRYGSCAVDGGHGFHGQPEKAPWPTDDCYAEPTRFPQAAAVMAFFLRHVKSP